MYNDSGTSWAVIIATASMAGRIKCMIRMEGEQPDMQQVR